MSHQAPEPPGGERRPPILIGAMIPAIFVTVVVVIAAVVVIALSGGGSARPAAGPGTSTTGSSPSPTLTAPHVLSTPTTGTHAGPSTGAGQLTPSGGPVPAGFVPESFTAVSDSRWWLLGDAPCSRPPCTSVVRTLDGGRSFAGIPAPRTDQVTGLRFADERDGYAYGQQLWSTHDGGASWRQVTLPAAVQDLAAGGGYVYAGTARGLLRSPVGRDEWTTVHRGYFPSVWVQGGRLFADDNSGSAPVLVSSADHGATFASRPAPAGTLACGFEATGGGVIWAPCATGMLSGVWRSADDGVHWGALGPSGRTTGGAASQPNSAAFAAAGGETAVYGFQGVYRTTDAGASWTPVASLDSGAAGATRVSYLGFTDATHGVAILSGVADGRPVAHLAVTTDAGVSYRPVAISR